VHSLKTISKCLELKTLSVGSSRSKNCVLVFMSIGISLYLFLQIIFTL